jgi:hypothetical protein
MVAAGMTTSNNLDPRYVQQEITALLVAYPELESDEVLRADSIEGQTTAFEFLSRIVRLIFNVRITTIGTAALIKELQERKARFEQHEERLKSLIIKVMNTAELGRKGNPVRLPEATLSIRDGVGHVIIVNEHEIPAEFMRYPEPEPDKVAIRAALANGGHVLGTVLSNPEPVLNLRVK